jgi:hypothetical protein
MANLRANKITSTEVFETTGSVQFDGDNDNLSIADSSDFNFGTGDFTIESWIYQSEQNGSESKNIYSQRSASENGISFRVRRDTVSNPQCLDFFYDTSGNGQTTGTTQVPLRQWNHVALTRSNGTVRIFLNGRLDAINDLSGVNFGSASNGGPSIGVRKDTGDSEQWNGHISNLRVLKGTALYTKNFTPPTRELTAIPNTVLLACQSKTQANQEATGKTITVNGNAVANELTPGLLTNIVKSGGSSAITGSVEFDGTGDYLLDSTGADGFNGGVGDWTIEAWMYCNDASQADVLINGKTSATDRFYINFIGQTIYVGDFNINNIAIGGVKQVNSWFHIAVTKSSSTYRAFINGIQIGSSTTPLADSNLTSLTVGYRESQNYSAKGFISNLRIIKGTALYTSNFIPPTRKLTRLPGTVLLCCQDSNNPTQEATGKTITGYGNLTDRNNIGAELVSNGTFDSTTTGWTAVASTLSVVSNKLRVTITSGYGYAYQIIPTVIGATYRVDFSYFRSTSQPSQWVQVGTSAATSTYGERVSDSAAEIFDNITFTALTTTTYITLRVNGTNVGEFSTFDNVSAKKLDPGLKQPFVPQIGSDGSVEFTGPTKINTPNYFYLPTGPTEQRGRGRGVFGGGGTSPLSSNTIDYVQISTQGNAIDFGDLTQARRMPSSCSSSTRGLWGGGYDPTSYNIIDYITIATTSNALDFGDLTAARLGLTACSNSTRGLFAAGFSSNIIDYVTISSTGNAIDFGDIVNLSTNQPASCSSSVRGVFAGGTSPSSNVIEYVTIQSTGNALDFGDLTVDRGGSPSGCSSPIRGIFAGGAAPSSLIDYITIASTGNAITFGNLTVARRNSAGCSNSIRGVFGGSDNPSSNTIDYITIASTGNAQDFGDLTSNRGGAACSDSHGGLG